MRIVIVAAALLLGSGPAAAHAQSAPDPAPIEEWSTARVSAMGEAIYRHDVAGWVATDAVMAHMEKHGQPDGMAGWIVIDEGSEQRVRFLRQVGGTLTSAFDVMVQNGRAGTVEVMTDGSLSAEEKASFLARQTAISNIGRLRCSPNLNAVVLDDPDSDGWLVWLLTATTDANIVPMGGHYRFRISADGSSVMRRGHAQQQLPEHAAHAGGCAGRTSQPVRHPNRVARPRRDPRLSVTADAVADLRDGRRPPTIRGLGVRHQESGTVASSRSSVRRSG